MDFFKHAELFDTHVQNLKVVPAPKVPTTLRKAGADGGCVVFKFHHGRVPKDLDGCSVRLPFVRTDAEGEDAGNGSDSDGDRENAAAGGSSGYALAVTNDPHPVK